MVTRHTARLLHYWELTADEQTDSEENGSYFRHGEWLFSLGDMMRLPSDSEYVAGEAITNCIGIGIVSFDFDIDNSVVYDILVD